MFEACEQAKEVGGAQRVVEVGKDARDDGTKLADHLLRCVRSTSMN